MTTYLSKSTPSSSPSSDNIIKTLPASDDIAILETDTDGNKETPSNSISLPDDLLNSPKGDVLTTLPTHLETKSLEMVPFPPTTVNIAIPENFTSDVGNPELLLRSSINETEQDVKPVSIYPYVPSTTTVASSSLTEGIDNVIAETEVPSGSLPLELREEEVSVTSVTTTTSTSLIQESNKSSTSTDTSLTMTTLTSVLPQEEIPAAGREEDSDGLLSTEAKFETPVAATQTLAIKSDESPSTESSAESKNTSRESKISETWKESEANSHRNSERISIDSSTNASFTVTFNSSDLPNDSSNAPLEVTSTTTLGESVTSPSQEEVYSSTPTNNEPFTSTASTTSRISITTLDEMTSSNNTSRESKKIEELVEEEAGEEAAVSSFLSSTVSSTFTKSSEEGMLPSASTSSSPVINTEESPSSRGEGLPSTTEKESTSSSQNPRLSFHPVLEDFTKSQDDDDLSSSKDSSSSPSSTFTFSSSSTTTSSLDSSDLPHDHHEHGISDVSHVVVNSNEDQDLINDMKKKEENERMHDLHTAVDPTATTVDLTHDSHQHNQNQEENVINDSKISKDDDYSKSNNITRTTIPAAATVKGSSRKNSSSWYARLELAVVIGVLGVFGAVVVLASLFFVIFQRKGTNSFDVQVCLLLRFFSFHFTACFAVFFPSKC
jgi:hypothetical protein